MKVHFDYRQHAVVYCSGVLEVPAEVIAQGDAAITQYVEQSEIDATGVHAEIYEFRDRVPGTFEYEVARG